MKQTRVIELIQPFKTIPNQLTGIRFLLVPILWVFALIGAPFYIGIGLIIAFLTDALDGHMARRLNLVSKFGAKLDSLADNLLTPSAAAWLLMMKPEIFADNQVTSVLALAIYASSLLVGWIKFGRLGNLHLYLSKGGGLAEYIFIIHAFLFGQYNQILFSAAVSMWILSFTETLVLQLTRSQVNEHIGSIVLTWLGKDAPREVDLDSVLRLGLVAIKHVAGSGRKHL